MERERDLGLSVPEKPCMFCTKLKSKHTVYLQGTWQHAKSFSLFSHYTVLSI